MSRRVTRSAVTDSKTNKLKPPVKSPAKISAKSPSKSFAKSPAKTILKKQSKPLKDENLNLRRSKRLSSKSLDKILDDSTLNLTKHTSVTNEDVPTTSNNALPSNPEQMEVDETNNKLNVASTSSAFMETKKNTLTDSCFKMPSNPVPKTKLKSKKNSDPLNELSNFLKEILTFEARLSKCNVTIPESADETMKNIDAVLMSSVDSNLARPSIENSIVRIDVIKLFAEALNQSEEFKFTEKFALFEKYLETSITERTVICIADPVLRLQVLFVRLMVDKIKTAHVENTVFRQEGLYADFMQQVQFYELQHKTFFGANQLFPAFYFVVCQFVNEFKNWESISWLSPNQTDTEKIKFFVESQVSRMLRRRDDAWCSLLETSQCLLQRSLGKDSFTPLNDSIAYNTGTVYVFLVLIAKCYESAIFYNRLEVNFDDQINRRHSWKVVNEFGKLFHQHFEGCNVIQEVTTLFYPMLNHQHNGKLVLSISDVITLTCQLSEMNYEMYSSYQCVYFQMAFSAIHYHLILEQLQKNNALRTGAEFLTRFTTFDFVTTWQSVLKNLSNFYSIPFTKLSINKSWNMIKPGWVMILLTLLTTVARKYIYSELVNQTTKREFPHLQSVFKHFDCILGKNQLTGHAIVAAFEQILG